MNISEKVGWAIAGRDTGCRNAFGERFGVVQRRRYTYLASVPEDDAVEAVYIATQHPFHAEPAVRAMRAGRHVLVEKPAGPVTGEIIAMTETAPLQGVFFMEGLMYRCHPQIARTVEVIHSGETGEVRHIGRVSDSLRFLIRLRVLMILNFGAARFLTSASLRFLRAARGESCPGLPFAEPLRVEGVGRLGPAGADEISHALLLFEKGVVAECAVSIRHEMSKNATVMGTTGCIRLSDPWTPDRDSGPSDAVLDITASGVARRESLSDPRILFAYEAKCASRRIRTDRLEAEFPGPFWRDSIGTAAVTAARRRAVGHELPAERPEGIRVLYGRASRRTA